MRAQASPGKLAAIAGAGGALIAVAAGLICLLVERWLPWRADSIAALRSGRGLFLSGAFLLMILGIAISSTAGSRLKKGVRLGWWSESATDALRQRLNWPVWTVLVWISFPAYFLALVATPPHSKVGAFALPMLFPGQIVNVLRDAARRPRVSGGGVRWHDFKPIRSEHWGQRTSAD